MMNVLGISGSVKQPSRTACVVSDILASIEKRASVSVDTIDLAVAAPILFMALRADQLDEAGRRIIDAVEIADVLVVGSPVYRASYTGALKHLFDLVVRGPCGNGRYAAAWPHAGASVPATVRLLWRRYRANDSLRRRGGFHRIHALEPGG